MIFPHGHCLSTVSKGKLYLIVVFLSQFHLIQGLYMTKPKLSNTAGLFTMFDHELLEQAKFDHQHTILNHGENQRVVIHHLDNIVMPILQKIEFVQAVLKCKTPIVKILTVKQHGLTDRFFRKFAKPIEPLMQSFFELLHAYTPPEIEPGMACLAFDHARSQLTQDEFNELATQGIGSSHHLEIIQPFVDDFLHFVELIKSYMNDPKVKKKVSDQNNHCKKMKMVCVGYIRQLLKVYSRLLVVRMDLSLMRDQQTLLKNAYSLKEIRSKHDLVHIKACVKKLLNNKRNNPVMKMVVGYILRFEYTVRTGFHVHCYFLFNGDKNLEDITLAQGIGKLWNKVTQGQGTSYICNMKKDSYRHCAIGMVHYADTAKLGYLYKTFDYICKTSQLFDFTNMKGARGFQLGEAPKKTSNAGRPRKSAQQLNLNF